MDTVGLAMLVSVVAIMFVGIVVYGFWLAFVDRSPAIAAVMTLLVVGGVGVTLVGIGALT